MLSPVLSKVDQLSISNEDELLKEIPSETLFLAIKNASADLTQWVFENALPDQIKALIDLNCWEGDRFLPEVFDVFFKNMSLQSPEKLLDYMKGIDSEIWIRGLMSISEVIDFDPQNPPLEIPEDEILLSPDNKYLLRVTTKDSSQKEALRLWLNTSSMADIELQRKFLEACKWEIISDLDEFQYQMKKGRLEEIGFVDYYEAIGLYSVGNAEALKKILLASPIKNKITSQKSLIEDVELDLELDSTLLPDVIIGHTAHTKSFFAQTLMTFKEGTQERLVLSRELARTLNAALSADKLLPKSLERIQEGIDRSHSYLSLGLLLLSKGQAIEAKTVLQTQKISDIFRLGWLTVQDLVTAGQSCLKNYGLLIFDEPDRAFLKSLRGRHPEISQEILANLELGIKEHLKNFDIKTLLSLGEFVQTLTQFAAWVLSPQVRTQIGIPEFPFLTRENSIVRIHNLIFRRTIKIPTDSYEGAPLSQKEWHLGAKSFQKGDYLKQVDAFLESCPQTLKSFLSRRIENKGSELMRHIQSSGPQFQTLPDERFFEALSFRRESK